MHGDGQKFDDYEQHVEPLAGANISVRKGNGSIYSTDAFIHREVLTEVCVKTRRRRLSTECVRVLRALQSLLPAQQSQGESAATAPPEGRKGGAVAAVQLKFRSLLIVMGCIAPPAYIARFFS